MFNWLVFVCLILFVLRGPDQLYAQFTDPRTYGNTPVDVNQLKLACTYARTDASIDTSIIIAGAEFNLNQGTLTTAAISASFIAQPGLKPVWDCTQEESGGGGS